MVLTHAPSLRKRKFQAAVVICHSRGSRNAPDSDLIFQKIRASLPLGDRVVTFGFIAALVVFGSKHEVAVRASRSDVNFPSYGRSMVYISASEHLRKLSTSSEFRSATSRKDPEPHGQMLKGQIYHTQLLETGKIEGKKQVATLYIHVQIFEIHYLEKKIKTQTKCCLHHSFLCSFTSYCVNVFPHQVLVNGV